MQIDTSVSKLSAVGCGNQALILAVDDDPSMLRLISFLLRRSGFEVLQAESGAQALELSRHEQRQIDLIVSDLIMPGMSAAELVKTLRQDRPDCRLLLCSGFADECEELANTLEHARSLPKPFSADALQVAVKAALNS